MVLVAITGSSQTTISQWTYEPLQGTTANPTPNTGSGSSALVGSMISPTTATGMNGTGCGGQVTGQTAWAIGTAAPGATNESSGAQFNVSTVGYNNVVVRWDQRWSNTATNTVRLQYTTDGTNWNNFTMTAANTTFCLGSLNNGRFEANTTGDQFRRTTVDLSSIPGVNNNSSFGFRVVAAHFQGTGQFRQTSNNTLVATAGTWRFDNVTVSGSIIAATPAVNLSVSSNTGTEAAASVITVTATASAAVTGDQTVSLGISGTNITGGDYNLSNATITILSGATTGSVTFTVVDDAVAEALEMAVLTISNPSAGITLGSTLTQSIDITDNDVALPTVDLSVSSNAGSEAAANNITVTATASAPVTGNQTVTLGVTGGGITGFDYTLSGTTITILSGQTTGTVTFKIRNDAEPEGTETAVLTINNPSAGISLGTTTTQNVAIADNICQALIRRSTATSTNGAEISAYDSLSKKVYTVAGPAIEYYSLSNAGVLGAATNMPFGFTSPGNNVLPNSVAIRNGIVAVGYAIVDATSNAQQPGVLAFYNSTTAAYISQVTVGYLPDMIIFSPDGTKILTANEGEPNSYGQGNSFDPEGSVSIVDISGGVGAATVQNAGFTSFNPQMAALKTAGVRIFGPGATVAQDLEPEYIAFSADGTKAFVTLQEANAIAEVDIASATVLQILPLGLKNHNTAGNGLDASDRDLAPGFSAGTINIQNWPVYGMYQPDAISAFTVGGNTYYITANEGDSRAYTGFSEEVRVGAGAYVLDAATFPTAATLKLNQNLGRMQLTNATGDIDNDGDFDQIHAFGARSFTIWSNTFTPVFDCGDQLEQITATQFPGRFNADNTDNTTASFDTRSDNKGPEPEAVTTGTVNGILYAFVGSERSGDIFVYDISDPNAPVFVQYIDHFQDFGVEGLIFVPAHESPTGKPLVIATAEISRTVTVYEFSLISASLPTVYTSITATQGINTSYGDCNGIIAKVVQQGASPISGSVTAKVWIEPTVPSQGGSPFVQRHSEITPAAGAATATGKVTLYFLQAEFDNFNSDPTSSLDLPTNPADAIGIANLRISKYPGVTNDGTGLPASYTGIPVVINPVDTDISWNASASRWEVSCDVTGFSGFFIQTSNFVLPVNLLSFSAIEKGNDALVQWKVSQEIGQAYYEVLFSTNGNDFTAAGQLSPATGTGEKHYSFTHANAAAIAGKLYYRLKMVSITSAVTYSNIVPVRFGVKEQIITDVYPSPTTGLINIVTTGSVVKPISLRITDMSGRVIITRQITFNGNTQIDITRNAPGIYLLDAVLPDGNRQQFKIIKQ